MDWDVNTGDEIVPGRRIQSQLGGGRRYQAFLTWNDDLLAPTVVKVLRPNVVDDRSARRGIAREADVLRRLGHPHFMRLLAADTDGRPPFLELEFLAGPRLSTLLRRHGALGGEQLFALGRELARSIHHLHAKQLVHLDVKPRNIIMGRLPRLIDLSIARRLDEVGGLRSPLGTDAYMAPEQCDPARLATIGPATDVWGAGVTLYRAATGELPFRRGRRDGTGAHRWPQLAEEPRPPDGEVQPRVAAAIMACLARDPAARPSALDMFDALDGLAARHGRTPRPLSPGRA